jgi:hypothetical protein
VVAGDSPAAFELDCGGDSIRESVADVPQQFAAPTRGRVASGHTHPDTPYFANAIDAGAELMVAATVLPGSPPPSGLIVNLVMFFDV